MNKIRIVNWLLTRDCNLNCSYCGIVREPKCDAYQNLEHYKLDQHQISTLEVIEALTRIKKHNIDCFHIFYGGEPLLRNDLPIIINFCNQNEINYTIITNNSKGIQKRLKNLFDKTEFISGLTSSVDPIIYQDNIDKNSDRFKKSKAGLDRLIELSKNEKIKDLVAEITIDNNNLKYLKPLVRKLSEHNISSSITFIDIAKNKYYDFSNVFDESLLVKPTDELKKYLNELIDEGYDIHMSRELINNIIDILPANLDCHLEESFHNLTIDADGIIRLCLRIRGLIDEKFLKRMHILNNIDKNGVFNFEDVMNKLRVDKIFACEGCNWTCQLMSKMVNDDELKTNALLHANKRRN